jgi:hypothetical protein
LHDLNYALVWGGISTKNSPQRCGLSHILDDEDIVQIMTKTMKQHTAQDTNYGQLAQQYQDKHAKMILKAKKKKQQRLRG